MEVTVRKRARGSSPSTTGLTVEVIRTREALQAYASRWNTLLEDSAARTIFLTWEWISAWLAVHPNARLLVIVVRDHQGAPVAIAPFYRTRMQLFRLVPYRCLRVLGDADSGADYPDIIVRSGFEERALPLIRKALLEHQHIWDCLWVPRVAGWTGAPARLRELCANAALHVHQRECDFASVELPTSHEAYFQSLSRRHRTNTRRHTAHVRKNHDLRLIRCERKRDLPDLLDALFDLHGQRWATVGQLGSFVRRPLMASFYRRFSVVALEKGWLGLYALLLNGVVRAVQYGYAYNGCFYSVQEGYDPHGMPGVGNVLRHLVLEACIGAGMSEYDFLAEFTDHKRHWGARRRFGHDTLIGRRSPKNMMLFAREMWPTGRYLRELTPDSS